MPTTRPKSETDPPAQADRPAVPSGPAPEGSRGFRESFGEDLRDVLDVSTWHPGGDLMREYARVEREVREALADEDDIHRRTRALVFPRLFDPGVADGKGGVFRASLDIIRLIHRGLLFNGGVEACDGTVHVHDTLPLTIYQVGVSLVSYRGDQGTWHQRLYRRDLRQRANDPVEEALQLLERRAQREALNHSTPGNPLGELARKAVMDYAERAILLYRSGPI